MTIREAADEIRPLGAGLSIWPNGVRALRALELDHLVDGEGVPRVSGALRRADGSVLAEFDPDVIAARYGEPLIGLHRRDLQEALLARFGADDVRLGSRLIDVEDDVLRFADGDEDRPDLAVGADGLRSVARGALISDVEPGTPRSSPFEASPLRRARSRRGNGGARRASPGCCHCEAGWSTGT